jgi:hypothetical protein
MSPLDDHHHGTKLDRDIARQREDSRIKQREWEQAHDPVVLEDPVASEEEGDINDTQALPNSLPPIEQAKLLLTSLVEQADWYVNETPLGESLPKVTGPAIAVLREALALYEEREAVIQDANDAVHEATRATKDVGQAAARSLSKGVSEFGKQQAQGMHGVGSSSYLDPAIVMQVNAMNEHARRGAPSESKPQRGADRDHDQTREETVQARARDQAAQQMVDRGKPSQEADGHRHAREQQAAAEQRVREQQAKTREAMGRGSDGIA